jgi:16S rRNA processing protein RimM
LDDDKLATAVVRTTHGVRGFLKVKVLSDDVDRFLSQEAVYLRDDRGRETRMQIEQSMVSGDNVLVKFRGIDTPEAGKRYNGHYLWISREDASELEDGEYYLADLIGCGVYAQGVLHGEVVSVVEGAQAELLEVRKSESGDVAYVPFMDVYVRNVDVRSRRIELHSSWILA